jgi:folate-binding protein YgfZ
MTDAATAQPTTPPAAAPVPAPPVGRRDDPDFVAEVRAVREAAGLVSRPGAEALRVTGPDRASFLHGVVSADTKKLPVGEGRPGFILNTKGGTVAGLTVLARAEEMLVLPWAAPAGRVAADLERFHIMEKVRIEDLTAGHAVIGLHGPAAADLLNDALAVDVTAPGDYRPFEFRFEGAAVVGHSRRAYGPEGFELLVPADRADAFRAALIAKGADHGLRVVGPSAEEALRIEAGIPRHPGEVNESVLGPELGMKPAFAGGKCYPGQEVVARIEARGHVNKRLCGLLFEGDAVPSVGDEVRLGERKVSNLTAAAWSPTLNRPVALGFVRKEAFAAGTVVDVLHAGTTLRATVAELPLVKG